jgi:hypothetical protein
MQGKHADFYLVNALSTLAAWFFILSVPGLRCAAIPGPIEASSADCAMSDAAHDFKQPTDCITIDDSCP